MANAVEKVNQLLENTGKGDFEVSFDMANGEVEINGVTFTIQEQLEVILALGNDDTFIKLLNKVYEDVQKKGLEMLAQLDKVITEDEEDDDETFMPSGLDFSILFNEDDEEDDEDDKDAIIFEAIIAELKKQNQQLIDRINELEGKASNGRVNEEDLTLADFVTNEINPLLPEISDEKIQQIIDELKGLEVPNYSFVMHRVGNVFVLKIHDDEGISYFVAKDYKYVNVN